MAYNATMTAVFVIRHPETTWNAAQRFQGRLESPLSTRGDWQAEKFCRAFDGSMLDAVYTSPLHRAHVLARGVAEATGATLRIDNRLTEIGQCPWEGLHVSEIERRYPDMYRAWYDRPDTVAFPLGEALTDVRSRALSVLEDVCRRHPEGTVALISHSVVIMMFVCAALKIDLRAMHDVHVANASTSLLCGRTAPGTLFELNNTSALYPSPVERARTQNCSGGNPGQVTQ